MRLIEGSSPAQIAVLGQLGLLSPGELSTLAGYACPSIGYACPTIRNTRGEEVGAIRARIRLDVAHAH